MIRVSPSILAADFANLEREIGTIKQAGAEYVHIDVMDGLFVPNISIGLPVLSCIRKVTDLTLDVHLMIDRPTCAMPSAFRQAGADIVTVHVEADTQENTLEALRIIRACGKKPAICVKPKTPAEAVLPFIGLVDLILVMTVEPGFGGQSFMADMMPKVRAIRAYIDEKIRLRAGGRPAASTRRLRRLCTAAGANVLVAGSAFFKAEDKAAFVQAVK
ncbi:MAG: ribulose-phosphate 3-epimerase [Acutalibacteraceae bacterium]